MKMHSKVQEHTNFDPMKLYHISIKAKRQT